jgi:hypothetical protein
MQKSNSVEAPDRLSVSRPGKTPPRPFSAIEIETLRRIADTLIPAADGHPSGGSLAEFAGLAAQAAAILAKSFGIIVAAIEHFSTIAPDEMWSSLEAFASAEEDSFYMLSMMISAMYLYSNEMKSSLNYPSPHRNPPEMFEIADELSSGILDPVMSGEFTYVKVE